MKVLIVGDGNSIHVRNFIKVVLSDFENLQVTVFNMNTNRNDEASKFYKKNRIHLINNNGMKDLIVNPLILRIPKVRSEIYRWRLSRKIMKLGVYDYCILHSLDKIKAQLAIKNKENLKNIIPVFWGSDLLRNQRINNRVFKNLFNISSKIILNTENMNRQFIRAYHKDYKYKTEVIKFPTLSFGIIDEIEKKFSREYIKMNLNLPMNKLIIICGHAGSRAERHEELIDEISKCNSKILDKCYFIFPMTYGDVNLSNYQEKVKRLIIEKNINGEVLCNYLVNREMLKYMIVADIHITVIKTDAFSSVMQENLYSGSYVIYGKWLNYIEFETNGIIAEPIEEISDIQSSLDNYVNNVEAIKGKLEVNKKLISKISSPNIIKKVWEEKVLNNL